MTLDAAFTPVRGPSRQDKCRQNPEHSCDRVIPSVGPDKETDAHPGCNNRGPCPNNPRPALSPSRWFLSLGITLCQGHRPPKILVGCCPGFRWRFNQEKGVRCAAGSWVRGAPSQSSGPPEPDLSTTFFAAVLRIIRARSSPSSPSFLGACGPKISLRRSFVAISSGNFSILALRVDRPPSGTAPQASPAGKKQRGRGQLLDHHRPQTHPQPQEQRQ